MADVTGKSPSQDQQVGGPLKGIGGGMKPGGFSRPSGNTSPGSDRRPAPSSTPNS